MRGGCDRMAVAEVRGGLVFVEDRAAAGGREAKPKPMHGGGIVTQVAALSLPHTEPKQAMTGQLEGGRRDDERPLPATSSFLALDGFAAAALGGGGAGGGRRRSSGSGSGSGAYDHLLAVEDEGELRAESSMMRGGRPPLPVGGFEGAAAGAAVSPEARGARRGGKGKGDGGFPTPPREAWHNLRAYGAEHFQVGMHVCCARWGRSCVCAGRMD
jgi:hypothetical protein